MVKVVWYRLGGLALPATAVATATVDGAISATTGAIVFAIAATKRARRGGTVAIHIARAATRATAMASGAAARGATKSTPAAAG